jgi:hypothetical protein
MVFSISGTNFADYLLADWAVPYCPVELVFVAIEGSQTYFIKTIRKNRFQLFSCFI